MTYVCTESLSDHTAAKPGGVANSGRPLSSMGTCDGKKCAAGTSKLKWNYPRPGTENDGLYTNYANIWISQPEAAATKKQWPTVWPSAVTDNVNADQNYDTSQPDCPAGAKCPVTAGVCPPRVTQLSSLVITQ